VIPLDEVWGIEIDVVGREEMSGNIYYDRKLALAWNNGGTVEVYKLSTVSRLGLGSLEDDDVFIEGNLNMLDIKVNTGSSGTTNWNSKLYITSVN
jgi:hypothetical protein